MFLIKFLASLFFIIVFCALGFILFFWHSIRNIKRRFDRLGRQHDASVGNNGYNSGQGAAGRTDRPSFDTDKGEYVDFEEA